MDRLKLSSGLIAFGGEKGIGKTRFALKLGNHLARAEKVLFLSYQDYSEKLITDIREMDGFISDNLEVNTSMDYYGVGSFLEIIKYVEAGDFRTVIIDDLFSFNRDQFYEFDDHGRDAAVDALLYLVTQLKIRLVFNIDIHSSHQNHTPRIRDFNWSRKIVNNCSQILALYRPAHFGITEDENGNSLEDLIEIYDLKNEENRENLIQLDSKKLNILYSRTY
jgi:KaiC/GvpD/RAD55 family RecA-like ATPase